MQTNEVAIQLDNVYFTYDGEKTAHKDYALCGVNLTVKKGEFLVILGHNGSGKSTLARLIDGLLSPSSGTITVLGKDIAEERNAFDVRRHVGIVFQNPDNQMVASIVEDDIAFGPENVGIPRKEIGERIDFSLASVGMQEYRTSMPSRLSGGQKQRIAIAGVLALSPEIMILDESTSMLDPRGRKEVLEVVKKLNEEKGITIVLITHFPEEAMFADRAIVMNCGEIVLQGKPKDVLKREEDLETFQLTLPRPLKICRNLTKGGVEVRDTLYPQTLARDILTVLDGRRAELHFDREERKENAETVGRVECENLSYVYNFDSPFATHALCGVDLTIESGEFFGIIGHTGSGKSTFLQHLNALIKLPTAMKKYKPKKYKKRPLPYQKLVVNGFDLTDKNTNFKKLRSKVGMVFQYPEYQLFAESVFEDVAFGLRNFSEKELSEEKVASAVKEALETVGLDYSAIKDKSPFELSGGQKRRVAIAGVIVTKPEILVLDEPAAGLDPLGKEQIMSLLKTIHAEWCKTVIVVSHDMDEIAENCTRAAIFSEGKVVRVGTPTELFSDVDEIETLGLDVSFTAKVKALLKKQGVEIGCEISSDRFVSALLRYVETVKEVRDA